MYDAFEGTQPEQLGKVFFVGKFQYYKQTTRLCFIKSYEQIL